MSAIGCICLGICLCSACSLVRPSGQNASAECELTYPKHTVPRTTISDSMFEKMVSPLRLISFDKFSRVPPETILVQTANIVWQLFNPLDVCKTRYFCCLGAWAPWESAAVQCAIDLEHHSELQEHHNIEQWMTWKRSVYPSVWLTVVTALRNTELTWLTWNSALGLKCLLGSADVSRIPVEFIQSNCGCRCGSAFFWSQQNMHAHDK